MGVSGLILLTKQGVDTQSQAIIHTQGSSLVGLVLSGKEIVGRPVAKDPSESIYGSVLAPWPNRIAGGSYQFDGVEYQLERDQMGNAIHGLVLKEDFQLVSQQEDEVQLVFGFGSHPGYPFDVLLEVTYRLELESLSVSARATNRSSQPAPFAIGFHPYFQTEEPAQLTLDVQRHFITSQSMIPVSVEDVSDTQIRLAAGIRLDDGYEGSSPVAALSDARGEITIRTLENMPHLMVYRPSSSILESGGTCVAIEPQSASANQFNSDIGPSVLEPRESKLYRFAIELAGPASSGVTTL